ncbi:DUF4365 domain-containing protein [Burkholderia sp. Bp9090]|uniref:DUF4365 domain-containing protein n=1 Tax=Burkholderia sp. Bp9090 TaxID=2184567 RepID=UPI000F6017BF|nr:DUF4365 domain-containing protein [Burkholderia sp. Bp9090]RQZ28385.1 DUF4365 domain-containing protein [Burkholderia sp. Bp9090]
MNAKEIGRAAGRIFAFHLPPNWIFRSQEDQEDYGVDGEIEIASPEDKATGFIFKAQIKGQLKVAYINQGTRISFDLSVDRLRYYMEQIETPIILVVVDVTDKKIFWVSLQDNKKIAEDLAKASEKKQKTVTVHLRAEDTIPERTSELLSAVERNMNGLRLHALERLTEPIDALVKHSHDDALKALLEQNKKVAFNILNEQFERLYHAGNFKELVAAAKRVIYSSTELVETRICAGLYVERVVQVEAGRRNPHGLAALADLYALMLTIVRHEKASAHLRRYLMTLARVLRLQVKVESDYQYFITSTRFPRESLTGWIVSTSRAQASGRASREVVKTVHLMNRMILAGEYHTVMDALPRLIPPIALFTLRLRQEKLESQADRLSSWLKFCVDLAIDVAKSTGNQEALAAMITQNAFSALDEAGKPTRIEESFVLSESIEDPLLREQVQKHLQEFKAQNQQVQHEMTPKQEIEAFRARALALGFNVDDPNDEMGQIIRQGLLDYNPERVVRDCESLVMIPAQALGVPAQMVGLPSAGMKWLYCLKLGHAMAGWRLDDIYTAPIPGAGFKSVHCDSCEFRQPRSTDWRWTSKWQESLAEEHGEIYMGLGGL